MGGRHFQQESEANTFAVDLLAPRALIRLYLERDPDLRDAQKLQNAFDISLEAAVRRVLDLRAECLAANWSFGGRVRYVIRGTGFP